MNDKSVIYDHLRQHKYMTLATSSKDGKPEAATVEFIVDGADLVINTFQYYRKYSNLLQNPLVACVVTTAHDFTLQFDGQATLLRGAEAETAKQKLLAADPDFEGFFTEETRFFRITPTWMRLRDYTQKPLRVTEYRPK